MAIAHVCLDCGLDLARIRSTLDAVYGLPIVRCPRCGTVAVRRRHPIDRWWRHWRRLNATLGRLALQVLLVVAFATIHMMTVRELAVTRWSGLDVSSAMQTLSVMLIVGAWLTAGFSHWPRGAAFASWSGFIGLLLLCRPILRPLMARAAGDTQQVDLDRWGIELVVLGLTMVMALAGIPLGSAVERLESRWLGWRRRRLRVKMRARRSS